MRKTTKRRRAKSLASVAYHPILQLPPLSEEECQGLRSSIAVNGVKVPILVDEQKRINRTIYFRRRGLDDKTSAARATR